MLTFDMVPYVDCFLSCCAKLLSNCSINFFPQDKNGTLSNAFLYLR